MPDHFIAFWNLENLFAPADFPRPEALARKIGRDLEGWDEALFRRKLAQLAAIIGQMNGGAGPDILGVCEVENEYVLTELTAVIEAACGRDYRVAHHDSELDRRGIDTAFIYDAAKFDAPPETLFSHFVLRRTGTRDIFQATFRSRAGNEMVILCNHWPSRSGGAAESAGFRATAGETLAYWHQRIRQEVGDDAAIIALGDFNDEPYDPSITFNALATRERGDVERARSAPRFFNMSWRYLTQRAIDNRGNERAIDGTLYFRGNGNVFDQILVSKPLLTGDGSFSAREETARIELIPEMISHRVSEGPIRFGLPRGEVEENVNPDGYSDHFPVSIVISEG
ncbi:MAG: endonuclease/exonuclease/phosphatase family protein [Pseudomonadota bacterium]